MSIPKSVAETIENHVVLEIEGIDRMYLNVYQAKLQHGERASVPRTETRRHPESGQTYPWLVPSTAMVNHYYFYCIDKDFGPFFLKFCSYFPYTARLCINGHEYLKRQLAQKGIAFEPLDNGLLSCDDPKQAQSICDRLSAEKIDRLLRKWLRRLPHPSHDPALGETAFRQLIEPAGVDEQRTSGMRFGDPAVLALFLALMMFRLLPRGFSNRDLRKQYALLLGNGPDSITPGQMTYQLRRLRLRGFIHRIPETHRYVVTDVGIRTAVFYATRASALLRPLAAATSAQSTENPATLPKLLHQLQKILAEFPELQHAA